MNAEDYCNTLKENMLFSSHDNDPNILLKRKKNVIDWMSSDFSSIGYLKNVWKQEVKEQWPSDRKNLKECKFVGIKNKQTI